MNTLPSCNLFFKSTEKERMLRTLERAIAVLFYTRTQNESEVRNRVSRQRAVDMSEMILDDKK